ncbi:MAG TPA: serine/threonine-protein kinase, partial [Nannocystaceae bacterium]|nr:serine/threonine-protein kinase [Nannocystaceae bacterium]
MGAHEPAGTPDEWTRLATRLFARAHERPRVAGRYEIVGQLGRGGMGVVYEATDLELGRKVAVKLLHLPSGRDGVEARARVRHEALALARLAHPNVVAIYDVCEHDGRLALVMEHVEGENLRLSLEQVDGDSEHPLPWRDVLARLLAAARGLEAAHASGLVHGDVKPDNVLIGDDGRVRIVDFGLAIDWRESTSSDDDTATTQAIRRGPGTPRYMAPEQVRGEPIGPWTDQFALCVTMREALDGRHPFAGDSVEDCLDAIVLGRWRSPPANTLVPKAIHRAIERGLAVDPAERWPSMRAFIAAIERASAPRPFPWTIALGVAGLVAVGAVFAGGDGDERCHDSAAPPWARHDRVALRTAVLDTGAAWADEAWTRIDAELGEFAHAWSRTRAQACNATVAQRDAALSCLDRVGKDADARAQVVAESSERTLSGAVEAVATLPDPFACLDAAPTDTAVAQAAGAAIEDASARVRALVAAGRYGEALPIARDNLRMADASGRTVTAIEATLELGGVLEA